MKIINGLFLVCFILSVVAVHPQVNSCNGTGYGQVLCMSLLFYKTQRSGHISETQTVKGRKSSAFEKDRIEQLDLNGGYCNDGDHTKYRSPMAYTITVLSWGVIAYPDAYRLTGQLQYAKEAIRWGTDYFLKLHKNEAEVNSQVGEHASVHGFSGKTVGGAANNGNDPAGVTAAALAAASIVFSVSDKLYAENLLSASVVLFQLADPAEGKYNTISVSNHYTSHEYADELAWAALWLYKAKNEEKYLDKATQFIKNLNLESANQFTFEDKKPGIIALRAELDGSQESSKALADYMSNIINNQTTTPGGLVYLSSVAPLNHAAAVSFIGLRAVSLGIDADANLNFAKRQADYMMGLNPQSHSYISGYGINSPVRTHHKSTPCAKNSVLCNKNSTNSHTVYGGLAGGPQMNDDFDDTTNNSAHNEASCHHNAAFTVLMAGLSQFYFASDYSGKEESLKQTDSKSGGTLLPIAIVSFILNILLLGMIATFGVLLFKSRKTSAIMSHIRPRSASARAMSARTSKILNRRSTPPPSRSQKVVSSYDDVQTKPSYKGPKPVIIYDDND